MYVLDDYPGHGKRGRMSSGTELESVADFSGNDSKITDQAGQIQLVQVSNANDALNYLINELSTRSDHGVAHPGALQQITHQPRSNSSNESGPIIAEVTDDLTDLSSEIMRHHSQQQTVVGLAQDTGNPSTTFLPRYPSYYPKYVDSVLEGGNTKYGQLNKQVILLKYYYSSCTMNIFYKPAQHGISSVDGRHDDFTFTNTQVLDRKVNTTVGIPQQRMQPITEALSQVGVSPKNSQQLQPMGVSPIATQSPFSTTPLISSMQPQHSPSMQFRQNSSPEVRWENSPVERNISSNLTNSTSKNVPSSQNFQQNLNTRVATGEFANNTDFYLPEDWDSLLSDNNLAIDSIHNGIAQNWDSDSFNDLLDYTHDSEFVGEGGIQGHSSHGLNQHKI
jgi:hypothetical protein